MPYFDRFDICEAYYALENDFHEGGWLQERASNRRRKMSTGVQLRRMGFRSGAGFDGFRSLSENGQEIYAELCRRYGFPVPCTCEVQRLIHGGPKHLDGCENAG